ncbi:hypothetical protein Trco_003342 [Trichoderma cornu-damae]|uniref:Uncharacterized protein n=1 Tax=Trichoderma cornu-damae TaxID=654480 RepID=A0A9P8TX70_9HYPO|nr:hypothetical protein Trco_003342 [Trichoderma cornu-damae]
MEMERPLDLSSLVFAALNYHLGTLGILSGPEVEKSGNLYTGILNLFSQAISKSPATTRTTQLAQDNLANP